MKIDETIRAVLNAKDMGEHKVLVKVEDLVSLVDYIGNLKFSNNSLRRDKVELQETINKLEADLDLALNNPEPSQLDTFA